ncbi:SspB family protein [Caenispirillum bisanense]|uniref:SspB family protein n=1 Tax=Caenispirillum bisanense TaxID=414052 RepID=UPI0031DB85CF
MNEHDDQTDGFNYEEMVEDALRGVLRRALEKTAAEGLPGQHHFYITFRTDAPGVTLPDRLKAQHPESMTIVLQHQFYDLGVTPDEFTVTLSFNSRLEKLVIPFAAVTAFADPFAKFGLQFHVGLDDDMDELDDEEFEDEDDDDSLMRHENADDHPEQAGDGEDDKGGDNVVTLDAFRKK